MGVLLYSLFYLDFFIIYPVFDIFILSYSVRQNKKVILMVPMGIDVGFGRVKANSSNGKRVGFRQRLVNMNR